MLALYAIDDQSCLSMKLSMTPGIVKGYSFSTTSSFSMKVFGCTKILRGWGVSMSVRFCIQGQAWPSAPGTYQFLLEDQVPDLTLPPGQRRRQLRVVLARARTVRSALPHLKLDEKLTRDLTAVGEHLVLVHLRTARSGIPCLAREWRKGRTLM